MGFFQRQVKEDKNALKKSYLNILLIFYNSDHIKLQKESHIWKKILNLDSHDYGLCDTSNELYCFL